MMKIIKCQLYKRNQRRPKYLEGHTVVTDWKTHTEKMSVLPTTIYRVKHSSYQNLSRLLCRYKLVIFTGKSPRIPKTILKEKNKGGSTLPDVKGYHIAAVIRTVVLSWEKHRNQWNRIQKPEIETHQHA